MNHSLKLRPLRLFFVLALFVAFTRLIPHAPNFTATLSAILFSALIWKSWKAFTLILIFYLIADIIINNIQYHQFQFQWLNSGIIWIIFPFVLVFGLNRYAGKGEVSPFRVLGSSLIASCIFFVTSNFGVWMQTSSLYTKDLAGLLQCYFNAIPFFGYEVAGTLFYSSVIFSFYWLFINSKETVFGMRK